MGLDDPIQHNIWVWRIIPPPSGGVKTIFQQTIATGCLFPGTSGLRLKRDIK
jgi:hypothetical protein